MTWNLVERTLVSPLCDSCGHHHHGAFAPWYYPNTAVALSEMRMDGWHITSKTFRCAGCVEDGRSPAEDTAQTGRWHHLHGWSVCCQACGSTPVRGLDPEGGHQPVWPTPAKAAAALEGAAGWTRTDRTAAHSAPWHACVVSAATCGAHPTPF